MGSREHKGHVRRAFSDFSTRAAQSAGSPWAFTFAVLVVLVWAVSGPVFGFSDEWQLTINTFTTIATFLMVFLLQHSQNKDTRALHVKLDELVAAVAGADNQLIDAEDLSDEDLEKLHQRYQRLAERVKGLPEGKPVSVEEDAPKRARRKGRGRPHRQA